MMAVVGMRWWNTIDQKGMRRLVEVDEYVYVVWWCITWWNVCSFHAWCGLCFVFCFCVCLCAEGTTFLEYSSANLLSCEVKCSEVM